jgi:hypothetical protein
VGVVAAELPHIKAAMGRLRVVAVAVEVLGTLYLQMVVPVVPVWLLLLGKDYLMQYAIIDNGTVVNIAEATPEFAASQGWIDATGAIIGGTWDGETFTTPPLPPTPVPQSISMAKARALLITEEKLDEVIAALASLPGIEGKLARSEFEYAQTVDRYRPLTLSMQQVLGKTDAEIDDWFILAASL